jgi:starch synthase
MADGDHDLLARLGALAAAHPQRIVLRTRFEDALSRRIYGGADFIAVPSRFEPCGLSQMFAMRYGAVPVVRATGGLADTVLDGETGLTFLEPSAEALHQVLERALQVFAQPEAFARLRAAALATDWSWTGPARAYAALYSDIAVAFTPRPA